jgi:hypothetical protein
MGFENAANPARLGVVATHCHCVRALVSGVAYPHTQKHLSSLSVMDRVAHLVLACKDASASDGLIYNTSLLAIERALHHRKMLTVFIRNHIREQQQQQQSNGGDKGRDWYDVIKDTVACHVDVLLHTATAPAALE